MSENPGSKQAPIGAPPQTAPADTPKKRESFRAVLYPHRSLSPTGFLILMSAIGGVSFVTGMAFLLIGAWPVFGFFGLDVALIYAAFKLNYRSGRLYETVELTPEALVITRVHPSGKQESFDFNPYWVRVRLAELPQGRNDLRACLARARIRLRAISHRRRAPRPVARPRWCAGADARRAGLSPLAEPCAGMQWRANPCNLIEFRFKPQRPSERENNPAQVTLSQPGNPA